MLGIKEGTDAEILDKFVGHFENTSLFEGNICLAAHNRGYSKNYFSNLKELEKGDIIHYILHNKTKKYRISEILIINESDWTMLKNTEDNRITLITCIENKEQYRLCVQGQEIED